jgi:D-alanine-D-alanine ligase
MKLSHDRTRMRRITGADQFGKVAVLYGGTSTEREVSLVSGAAVLAALQRRGIDAHGIDPRDTPLAQLPAQRFDRVWIALHGPGGEDGTVQGALEVLGVPYTGSGVLGSALGMDKLRTKRLAGAMGVMTAESVVLRTVADCSLALERLGLPLIVKPATQGSSVGMTRVASAGELEPAFRAAAAVDDAVFAEKWITGAEYTVAVLHRRVLPAIRIETANAFYDYEAKYKRNDTRYHCPAGLSAQAEAHMASLALAAFDAVGAEGWGRADFMADHTGRPLLLEINTVPGMTDHSLVPMAARAAGIDFDELCWQVLETSFVRAPVDDGEARR